MNEYIQMAQEMGVEYGIKLVTALLIYIIGRWVAKLIKKVIMGVLQKSNVDALLVTFAANLTYAALIAFVVLAALSQIGIETTSFIAILGAAGLAVGLALQGSLANFAAGVLMIIFRPFKVGDFIEAAGVSGVVEGLDIFTTRMRTGDNKAIIIPNGNILNGNIVNYSAKETRRIDMVVGIGYDSDIKQAKQILEEIINADERILKDPAPTIGVLELADSSVNIAMRPWVNTADFLPVTMDLNETIKLRFDAAGISIPFPQRDVHLYQAAS